MGALTDLVGTLLVGVLFLFLLRYALLQLFNLDIFNLIGDIWNGLLDLGSIVGDALNSVYKQTTKALNSAYKNTLGKVF